MQLFLSVLPLFAIVIRHSKADHPAAQNARADSWCIPAPATGERQAEIFTEFQRLAWSGNADLIASGFHQYVVEDYIQHNPFLPQGAAPVVQLLQSLVGTTTLEVKRVAFDGE